MQYAIIARVYGIVQGVGFRPTVDRLAAKHGICGSVSNKGPYVEIDAQGEQTDIDAFITDLLHHPPQRAVILKLDREDAPENIGKDKTFSIIESEKEEGEIFVSPDIAICPECKRELFDPQDRRYLHPFINCTSCGPRTTILDGMPYDRIRTSMADFPMCPSCEFEYTHPETRRYDAQPVCCNDCGPQVYLLPADGSATLPAEIEAIPPGKKDAAAITETRRIISEGGIVAIKGIGGFHLCCDATNSRAVQRLRDIKPRPAKPFAVMMRDPDTVRRECELTPLQEEILDGHQKPIILLKKRIGDCGQESGKALPAECGLQKLAPEIAPDNPAVGVMLPYAPVQLLLFDYPDGIQMPDCLVMTSGNVSGAPICRDDADAVREIGRMCDAILSHNRLIRLRADDSVMDFFEEKPYMIRRSRGYAPLPFLLDMPCQGSVLAVGGELKNTFCVAKNHLFYPSPYVGDMEDLRTVRALEESVRRMSELLETRPEIVVCDLHPKYNTTEAAVGLAKDAFGQELPVIRVQHHYAHIVSCMAENNYFDQVIGVSFDGTGYGTDGTIWGGEFMLADLDGFKRLGCIEPFLQIGGDASAKEGWRIAVSMLYSIYRDKEKTQNAVEQLGLCGAQELKVQFMMADRGINSVRSTSAGRLFDAVSALLGIRRASSFEGEASTTLQFRAEHWEERMAAGYTGTGGTDDEIVIRELRDETQEDLSFCVGTLDLLRSLAEQRMDGADPDRLAWEFHRCLADGIVAACEKIRKESGINAVALSGGVFQNKLLLRMCAEDLRDRGFHVLLHSMLPPNDGGLCLGQAAIGMRVLGQNK